MDRAQKAAAVVLFVVVMFVLGAASNWSENRSEGHPGPVVVEPPYLGGSTRVGIDGR